VLIEVELGDDGRVDLSAALSELARRDVVRLLVEGGASVHGALLRAGLAQRAAVFVAPRVLGDPAAMPLASVGPLSRVDEGWSLRDVEVTRLGHDVLFEGDLVRSRGAETSGA
jgi:diaminohydroxyphosphoribosylaminopyrimidine deaminase/5-amino-6-(5-phosphoribosylamino)uracil reductase